MASTNKSLEKISIKLRAKTFRVQDETLIHKSKADDEWLEHVGVVIERNTSMLESRALSLAGLLKSELYPSTSSNLLTLWQLI